jgi:O-antigen/teichoic acid export membrane protein
MSIGAYLIRGSGVNLLDHLVKISTVFYMAPLMRNILADDGYGSWLLAMNVISVFMLFDMGVSFASTRAFALAVGSKDSGKQSAVLKVSRNLFRVIGLAILASTLATVPIMPWLAAHDQSSWAVIAPLAICGVTLAVRFFWRMPMVLLRAHVRYDLLAWCSICRSIVQVVLMTIALRSGYGLIGAALTHGFGDCFELGLQVLMAKRLPRHKSDIISKEATNTTRRNLVSYSGSLMLVNLGESFRLQVNPFLISKMFGVSQLPVYSLGMRLITMLEDVINALFGGQILAAFSQLHGAEKHADLRKQFLRVTRITVSFSAWAVGGMAFYGESFFKRWMGEDFDHAYEVMLILAIPYGLRFMQYPAHSLLYALNRQKWLVWSNFIGGITTVVLALLLAPVFGLNGLVIGTALEMSAFYILVMPWLIRNCTGINSVNYLCRIILVPGLVSLALPATFAIWTLTWLTPDYGQLLLCGLGYSLVFAITSPWLTLDAGMRRSISLMLKKKLAS